MGSLRTKPPPPHPVDSTSHQPSPRWMDLILAYLSSNLDPQSKWHGGWQPAAAQDMSVKKPYPQDWQRLFWLGGLVSSGFATLKVRACKPKPCEQQVLLPPHKAPSWELQVSGAKGSKAEGESD